MTRLKFLVFALAVLALWLAHLLVLTPAMAGRAVDQASAQAAAAPAAVAVRIDERRIDLQKAALKLVGAPNILATFRTGGKAPTPTPENFAALRAAMTEALPE